MEDRLTRHAPPGGGRREPRIRDYPTAAEYLTLWFDRAPPPRLDDPDRTKYDHARVDLDRARAHVGALDVQVSERGAEVLVDGRRVGFSPLEHPVFVQPGEHRLGLCVPSICVNGFKDSALGESSIDCGGLCDPCATGPARAGLKAGAAACRSRSA